MQALLLQVSPTEHPEKAMGIEDCFLDPQEAGENFSPSCFDPELAGPSGGGVLLWGDSHAAQLYPGLAALYSDRDFRLMRLTAAGCPPIVDIEVPGKPRCQSVNAYVKRVIEKDRPHTVIVAGNWVIHDVAGIRQTISFLKSCAIHRVVLVGPVPQWTKPLHKIVVSDTLRDPNHVPPLRIAHSLVPGVAQLDLKMQEIARETSVEYVSAWSALCNGDGCLARIGESDGGPMTLDREHITPAGSVFLVGRLFDPRTSRRLSPAS
jgi:hypothetical protein